MTKRQMVREAMEFNRCAIIASRYSLNGELATTIAGFKERRNTLIARARSS